MASKQEGGAGEDCGGVEIEKPPIDSSSESDSFLPPSASCDSLKPRAFLALLRKKRRPRVTFVLLSTLQLVFGLATFSVGVAAFTSTRSYMVGSFWAGPVVSLWRSPRDL